MIAERPKNNWQSRKRFRRWLWKQDPRCSYCQLALTFEESTLDHVMPLTRGGTNAASNLLLSCVGCNVAKGSMHPDQWELLLGDIGDNVGHRDSCIYDACEGCEEEPDYHRDYRSDSNSSLGLFRESIEKYAAIRVHGTMDPDPLTPALILGIQLHTFVLLGENALRSEYAIGGPINPKTGKTYGEDTKAFAEWAEDQGRAKWMGQDRFDLLLAMRDGIMRNKDARAFIEQDGVCEYRIDWTNTATGLPMKCRFDKVNRNGLKGDLKTTDDVSPEAFARTILNYGYHCQQDIYDEGGATEGIDGPFMFIAVSKSPPHECAVHILEDPVWMILARERNLRTMQELAQCRATGDWRGRHSRELNRVPVPAWAAKLTANEAI